MTNTEDQGLGCGRNDSTKGPQGVFSSSRLKLERQAIRVLSGDELGWVAGGVAPPGTGSITHGLSAH